MRAMGSVPGRRSCSWCPPCKSGVSVAPRDGAGAAGAGADGRGAGAPPRAAMASGWLYGTRCPSGSTTQKPALDGFCADAGLTPGPSDTASRHASAPRLSLVVNVLEKGEFRIIRLSLVCAWPRERARPAGGSGSQAPAAPGTYSQPDEIHRRPRRSPRGSVGQAHREQCLVPADARVEAMI